MRLLRIVLALIVLCFAAASVATLLTVGAGTDLGTLWHANAPESLNLTQAITQRYIHPLLWTDVLLPVLLTPAAVVFSACTVIALLLWLLAWRMRKTTR